ncbi:GatB/YqeY domain-containing protein [Candidatus Gottesmanbacteria bacterium]|nr:GatB/YqeY domain-containing protein [Candidatus Gottesmanbacteria bacterium]
MLIDTIKSDLVIATKRQDPEELKTIRYILSEINYAKIDKQRELSDQEIILILQKEVKKRQEAIELMKKADRNELVTEEENKLRFITKYLPELMTNEEIMVVIKQTKDKMPNAQMGQLIGAVMGSLKGRADGSKVAMLVTQSMTS